jgi:aryl-alcohol dehydrogenase-like predicted oxidoreductase
MGLNFSYGKPTDKRTPSVSSVLLLKRITFFDTAQVYGPFTNEEIVGEALAPFEIVYAPI